MRGARARAAGPRDLAARALHRGDAREGARGPRASAARPRTRRSSATILDRGYVVKKGTALVPTFLAFAVTQAARAALRAARRLRLHREHGGRPRPIAAGEEQRVDWLTRFYKGDGRRARGSHAMVTDHLDEIDARAVNSIEIPRSDIVVRVGRYGPYLERGERARVVAGGHRPRRADARARPRSCSPRRATGRELGVHPETGRPVLVRSGRYGPYVTEELAGGRGREAAHRIALLSRCRRRRSRSTTRSGSCRSRASSASRRRRGGARHERALRAVLEKGKETRSLESEEQIFTIDLDQALALLAAPKQRRGRGAPKPPLRELGARPLVRASTHRQGRPIWSIRDRRGDQCQPASRGLGRIAHARPGGRAARRAPREGAGARSDQGAQVATHTRAREPANLFARTTS